MHATTVTADRTAETARVSVAGEVEQLAPFLTVQISVQVEGPVERLVDESP